MSLRPAIAARRPKSFGRAVLQMPLRRANQLLLAQRIDITEEVITSDSLASSISTDPHLFKTYGYPLLHTTLAAIRDNFVNMATPSNAATDQSLVTIRRAVAEQAKRNVPILGDSFPWLLDSADHSKLTKEVPEVEATLVPAQLDPLKFTTNAASKWRTLLESIPLTSRNLKSDWLDIFHAIANNAAWHDASRVAEATAELILLVKDYQAATATGKGYSEVAPIERTSANILETALTPQWMRKMRAHFIKMHRLQEYTELFKVCVTVEETIAKSFSPIDGRIPLPSLVADDEHLGFFTVLYGRREAEGSKAARWDATLESLKWALPRLANDTPTKTAIKRFTETFRMVANVATYIHNDGNEDRRAGQLLAVCCSSLVVDAAGLIKLTEAIEASLLKKISVTSGLATQSVLRALSLTFTIKHKLASMPSNESSMKQILPLLYHKEKPSDAPSTGKDLTEEVLEMPAAIVRLPSLHITYLATATKGVVGSILEVFKKNKAAASASSQSLINWLQKEVSTCTAIPDWRHVGTLVAALLPLQRVIRFDFFGGLLPPSIAPINWSCGCGASNTLLAASCWSCVAEKKEPPCVQCGAPLLHSSDIPCRSCSTPHPRAQALSSSLHWQCKGCSNFNATSDTTCAKCETINPAFVTHSCKHCGSTTTGEVRDPFCGVCGEAVDGMDARLVLCRGCSKLHPIAFPSCPYCHVVEPISSARAILSHFTWRCGCKTQNSPLSHTCRTCGADGHQFSCGSCYTKGPTTRRRLVPTLPSLTPFECTTCNALHPRDAALLSRRLSICPTCHATVPLHKHTCNQCGGAINNSATRFMPSFADMPWSCHSCGTRNLVLKEDAESALRCVACEVDRVNPLLFSEVFAWDCSVCGTQRNYGFSCRRCESLQSSIPEAEVTMWKCGQCSANNPSWLRNCKSCTKERTASEVTFKYVPWQCSSCDTYNSPSRVGSCSQCGSSRPPLPVCGLCHGRHLKVECLQSSRADRSEGLEAILSAAALEADIDPLSIPLPSVFDDPLESPFLL